VHLEITAPVGLWHAAVALQAFNPLQQP